MPSIGKALIIAGSLILILGLVLTFFPTLRLGRLPGDITIRRDGFTLYLPITTSILVTLALNLLFWLYRIWRG